MADSAGSKSIGAARNTSHTDQLLEGRGILQQECLASGAGSFGRSLSALAFADSPRLAQSWPEWRSASKCCLFVLFYAVLANVPFWVAAKYLRIERNGWLCLDYLCIGALALFVPRIVAGLLMLGTMVADALCAICESYFLSLSDCVRSFSSLYDLPARRLRYVAAAVLLAVLVSTIAALLPRPAVRRVHRLYLAACMMALAAVLLFADCARLYRATGALPASLGFHLSPDARSANYFKFNQSRISRLSMKRLIQDEMDRRKDSREWRSADNNGSRLPSAVAMAGFSGTALPKMQAAAASSQMPNLVLVLVESWGLASDPGMRELLVRPYQDPHLREHYRVLQGTVPFYGPTVAGEARELCGSHMGFHLLDASAKEINGCLPDDLAALGYHTVGIHGHAGGMFRRSTWYRTIGFQETWFQDRFQQMGFPECDAGFTGICDANIAQWIGNRLHAPASQPSFLYWVTLNSHLPVPIPSKVKGGAPCASIPSGQQYPALCSWFQLVSNVHQSVARIAESNPSRPTVFVIVGDHAPPFVDPFLRGQFSDAVVPYLILEPRK